MRIILLKDVPKVGKRGEIRDIADGYALNFLIPRKLAEPATPKRVSAVQEQLARTAQQKEVNKEEQMRLVQELDGTRFEITVPANDKGHLYEKLTAPKLDALIPEVPLELFELEDPIKEVGEHAVRITAGEAHGTITVVVSSIT